MELKYALKAKKDIDEQNSNRTIMELKFWKW